MNLPGHLSSIMRESASVMTPTPRADPDWDLGYPATAELADGSLFSVYYQKAEPNEKGSILWSRWQLNEETAK